MEIITQLLNAKAEVGQLGYHPRCKCLSLNLLYFTDNLLTFTDYPEKSYSLSEVFYTFYGLSGLELSLEKYEFYAAGISDAQRNFLAGLSSFKMGSYQSGTWEFP